jgi:hypothetical protein
MSKVHTIQRENIYLRVVKKGTISEKFGNLANKETTTSNSSFIETFLKDLTKQILCSEEFKNIFTNQIEEQPLSLYKWTNDQHLPTLGKLRQKYINNLKLLILSQIGDPSERIAKRGKSIIDSRTTHSRLNSSQVHYNKQYTGKEFLGIELPKAEDYNDAMDNEIQEKYIKDLLTKYKYSIKEVNEKIILINDETKKLISDTIMENTIYNLISQTVYGEIDLTVKPRIYFFLGKGENLNVSESANLGNVQKNEELKTSNNLIKSESNINKSNIEENKNDEKDKNSKIIQEDKKSNNSSYNKKNVSNNN